MKNKKRFSEEELRHFRRIFDAHRTNFPKICSRCGTIYQNEREYIYRTDAIRRVGDYLKDSVGILFCRNCNGEHNGKRCGSTLGLVLNPAEWHPADRAEFVAYLDKRARKKIRRNPHLKRNTAYE